jgi:hypothetical protein
VKHVTRIIGVGVLAATLAGCAGGAGGGGLGSNSISQAQYDSISTGEPASQVRSDLGKPESIDKMDMNGLGHSEIWSYSGPGDTFVTLTLGQKGLLHPHGPMIVQTKSIG